MAESFNTVRSYGSTRVSRALVEFLRAEASGGLIMLAATAVALVVANSGLSDVYHELLHQHSGFWIGSWSLELSLHEWVNDGLMAVFFFLVGLEIKRELLFGELASPRRAALPVLAAVGGAVVPAGIYLLFNAGGSYARGWGIPMATDIAFAVTVLVLLGSRAPLWLKSFVTALAIADDILAVLVIALFYSASLDATALMWAGGLVLALAVANSFNVQRPAVYVILGIGLWYFVLQSGIHATIAGVLTAAFVPAARRGEDPTDAATSEDIRDHLEELESSPDHRERWELVDDREAELESIALAATRHSAPLYRLEHAIHPWSAFFVLPTFALFNAGVEVPIGALGSVLREPLALGVMLGLFFGKQVGITGFTWLVLRLGLGRLPEGATWRQLWGGAALAGIGFTMSIFIATLAFGEGHELELAKLAVLLGSLISAAVGIALLRSVPGPRDA
ncbi:MAG: Na+/H+ antiporter NhaA, partial [Gemmatimonadota bacterium]|nr:Na+/H+ antiporter NhaA [Gemmatimonadota bacterium]